MRVMLKRYVTRDASGRPIAVRVERVTDDEAGRVQFSDERTAHACSGCGHFSTGIEQRRGVCQVCQRHECCEHCAARCSLCQRLLCGHCRRGFAGASPLTVCAGCLETLRAQQQQHEQLRQLHDQRQQAVTAFEQYFRQQQLVQQSAAHRLREQHAGLSLQLQAARLGLRFAPPPKPRGPWAFVKRAAKWMARGVGHAAGLR